MPIVTAQVYINNLLNGLVWPPAMTNVPALESQITPLDPQVEAQVPQAYVWPTRGKESRDPKKGGTVPRAASFGAPSGLKSEVHNLGVWLVWFGADTDQDADNLFPGMVDWVMVQLRSTEDPTPIQTDPWSGIQSYLLDIGEDMDYEITLRSLLEQRYDRYDALITLTVSEVFPA